MNYSKSSFIEDIDKLLSCGKLSARKANDLINKIKSEVLDDLEAIRLKSMLLFYDDKIQDSLSILNYGLTIYPTSIRLYHDIISIYIFIKKHDLAFEAIESAVKIDPKNEEILILKASLLLNLGDRMQAIDTLNKILSINDSNLTAIETLSNVYYSEDIDKSVDLLKRAITLDRKNYLYHMKMSFALLNELRMTHSYNLQRGYELLLCVPQNDNYEGVLSEGMGAFLKFLDLDNYDKKFGDFHCRLKISSRQSLLRLVFMMSRVESFQDRIDLKNAFKKWGETIKNRASIEFNPKFIDNNSKKIRLGIGATTIYDEHVFHFIRPIIELLDKSKFELYVYTFKPIYEECNMYKIVKARADKLSYHNESADPNKTRNDILSDKLDVLLEAGIPFLSPEVMAEKLAPVQISWLDCPASNGLSSDYIIVDPYINPEEKWLLEKPLILENTWVAVDEKRFKTHIITDEIPQDRNGYVTFGTMNSTFKITRETFRVWADIMNKVPNSRFLYVRPEVAAPIFRSNFYKYMDEYGISRDRISFFATITEHLNQYHNIDIALDTFPHTGGTTTCESLWMGVPVITLVGPCFFERLSYSNLMNSGLGDLCAFNIKDYQKKAIDLAFDVGRRRLLKKNLRSQIMSSPLGNSKDFVRNLENIISQIVKKPL